MFGWLRGHSEFSKVGRILGEIEPVLVRAVPRAVQSLGLNDSAYAIILGYIDSTTNDPLPFACVAPERVRTWMIQWHADTASQRIWRLPEIQQWCRKVPLGPEFTPEFPLKAELEKCYSILTKNGSVDDEVRLKPVRNLFTKVARTLNGCDWSTVLPTTNDFAVIASDWSGFWVEEDARQSLPPELRLQLEQEGLFFGEPISSIAIDRKNQLQRFEAGVADLPVSDRIQYWLKHLHALAMGQTCPLGRIPWHAATMIEIFEGFGSAASKPLVELVSRLDDYPFTSDGLPSPSNMVQQTAFDALEAIGRPRLSLEQKLRDRLARSIEANRGRKQWTPTPFRFANVLSRLFGYPAPSQDWNNVLCEPDHYLKSPLRTKA